MIKKEYDFIIVGSGPSGSSLAFRISRTPSAPSVLLIEAGSTGSEASCVAGSRNTFWASPDGLALDHGYKTTPQPALKERELPYHRGKCLGGSTVTNIGVWDWGSRTEMDMWAEMVGDEVWRWESVRERIGKIEAYHDMTPEKYKHYARSEAESHGKSGPVNVTLPEIWDPCLPLIFDAIEAHGLTLNPDLSSSKSIGMGVSPATVHANQRVSASSAYLQHPPDNLHILPTSTVSRILFSETRAVAVELIGGQGYRHATKEIILCAGAIDTPKLLLLSGIRPASDLATHHIPLVLDQPYIGADLMEHPMIRLGATIKQNAITAKPLAATKIDIAAAAQGYLKIDPTNLPALSKLDEATQRHLNNELTPNYELLLRIIPHPAQPDRLIFLAVLVFMNCLSRGQITLRSNDPSDPPNIDLNLLSHAYDIQNAVQAIRSTIDLLRGNSIIPTEEEMAMGPRGVEEGDIEEYLRSNLSHLWHACGTVKMGKAGEERTCVTPDFKVQGVQGLRVVDLSVVPVIPSCHLQSTGYLIGEVAAEKIGEEWGL